MDTIIPPRSTKGYSSEGLTVDLNAGELARLIAEELRIHLEDAMTKNAQPDSGGGKPPFSPNSKAGRDVRKGTRPSSRGVTRNPRLQNSFATRKFRGKRKGRAQIRVGSFFVDWLDAESRRGSRFVEVKGDAEKAVDRVVKKVLDKAIK